MKVEAINIGREGVLGPVESISARAGLHLQEMTRPGIIKDMIHRGGLNADILVGGKISVGDAVTTIG